MSGRIPLRSGRLHIAVCSAVNEVDRYADCKPWFLRYWAAVAAFAEHDYETVVVDVSPSLDQPGAIVSIGERSEHIANSTLNTAFVAQCVRLLAPSMLDADLVLISDIDMFPLTTRVFDLAVSRMRDAGADVCIVRDVLGPGQIAMCYLIATPSAWRLLFPDALSDALQQWWTSIEAEGYVGGDGPNWCFDQITLYKRVTELESSGLVRVVRLKDYATAHRRLDRVKHAPRLNGVMRWLIKRGTYSDYHTHLPVDEHQEFLTELLDTISTPRS